MPDVYPTAPGHAERGRKWVQGCARHSALFAPAVLVLCMIATPLSARERTEESIVPPASTEGPAASSLEENSPGKSKADILIAPVPFTSPSTGTGLAGGVVAFYNPNAAPQPWISGGGVVWTKRGTKGGAVFHSMSLDADQLRIEARASYLDAVEKYYGIGKDDGDRGDALELANKTLNLQAQVQGRVFSNGYAGLRYRLITTNAEPKG